MIIYCDGASNPHTKRSGIGAVWFEENQLINPEDGKTLKCGEIPIYTLSEEIKKNGGYPTNNEAEYQSLIKSLKFSIENDINDVIVYMDSKLVVNQVQGLWRINFPHLQYLKNEVDKLKKNIKFKIKHIRRGYNKHADLQSKLCLEEKIIPSPSVFDAWKIN